MEHEQLLLSQDSSSPWCVRVCICLHNPPAVFTERKCRDKQIENRPANSVKLLLLPGCWYL